MVASQPGSYKHDTSLVARLAKWLDFRERADIALALANIACARR